MYIAQFKNDSFIQMRDKDELAALLKHIKPVLKSKSRIKVKERTNPDHGETHVTSIAFKKSIPVSKARKWLKEHGFKSDGVREISPSFNIFPLVSRSDFSEYRREYWDDKETILATYGIKE